jgi:iron-sulfur cluster assembly accessory protein
MKNFLKHQPKKVVKFITHTQHSIQLTESTIDKISNLKKDNANYILRIIINGGGCQGFQYEFQSDTIDNIGEKTRDIVLFDEANQTLLIVFDVFSEFYINESKINYISNLLESGFRIEENPKAKSSCGCKKSFASDEFYTDDESSELEIVDSSST